MDDPVPHRLRPATRCGLTSPDQVTAPARPDGRHTQTGKTGTQDKPQNRERRAGHTHSPAINTKRHQRWPML